MEEVYRTGPRAGVARGDQQCSAPANVKVREDGRLMLNSRPISAIP